MTSVFDLTVSSGLIFSGTVVERGRSTVSLVPASSETIVVRVDRGLRVDPVHGELGGKLITVVPLAPEALAPGEKAVFFTNSWIHGQGIAVREVAHLDIAEEEAAAQAVAELPKAHLLDRLRTAELVARAEVVHVSAVERTSFAGHGAAWAAAELRILKVLGGQARDSATVYFPTSDNPKWASAPRFKERQRGIFILHAPARNGNRIQADVPADALLALDPADFQPTSRLRQIEKQLGTVK